MSLLGALSMTANTLEVFSSSIQVAGNNIANANTPGYVREEVVLTPSLPAKTGALLIGNGVRAKGVKQQIDTFLESRLYNANTDAGSSSTKNDVYQQLQVSLNELGDQDLSTQLNTFLGSLQNVANQPEAVSQRQAAIQQGQLFTQAIVQLRGQIDSQRQALSDKVNALVNEANKLINTIQNLNPQISQLEANGLDVNDAGALRVQRLNALNRLSEIMPIKVVERPSRAVDVYSGNEYLILDGHTQNLETVNSNQSGFTGVDVQLSQTKSPISQSGGGELRGTLDGRDQILSGFVNQLDSYTKAVMDQVNRIHASGEGLAGYTTITSSNAVSDPTAALNNAGLPFTPNHGSFQVKIKNVTSGTNTTSLINVDLDGIGSDTSLNSLVASLNGVQHLNASVTLDGHLKLTTDAGYEVSFSKDTSGTLATLGVNTFFTGTGSDNIAVNTALVKNQALLATGQGGGASDGSNILAMSKFSSNADASLSGLTVDQYYGKVVGGLAQSAATEKALSDSAGSFKSSLQTQRQQTSGVSLDEEAIKVLQLQRSYQSAAKLISTIDQLFNTLLQA